MDTYIGVDESCVAVTYRKIRRVDTYSVWWTSGSCLLVEGEQAYVVCLLQTMLMHHR